MSNGIHFTPEIFTKSTKMMEALGGLFGTVFFHTFFAHLFFIWISCYGVFYALKRLLLPKKTLITILIMLSLPSFCVWTSILGKEAIGCFATGIITGYLIECITKCRFKLKLIELFAFYLLALFKPQYLIALFHILFFVFITKKMNLKSYGKLFLLISILIIDIYTLYYFSGIIDELSQLMVVHFQKDAGSTRVNEIWVNDGDFFRNMPYGMFLSLLGPTLHEVIEKPVQSVVFIESIIIFIFWIILFSKAFIIDMIHKNIHIVFWAVSLFLFFWITFVHYPFGVMNPGSALRYKENFYLIFIVLPVFLYNLQYKNAKSK
jgi:hypothetical protein